MGVADDTPAGLVRQLRREAGSHDKLAAELGTSRQRIIAWEKGSGISADYAVKLGELAGLPAERFRPSSSRRLALEAQVADNAETIRDLALEVKALTSRLDAIELQLETQRHAQGGQ